MISVKDSKLRTYPENQSNLEVVSLLAATGYADLQNVHCVIQESRMILMGTVPSFYLKQVAQTVASKIDGVGQIENRLEVCRPRPE